jgi:hypothetical protein
MSLAIGYANAEPCRSIAVEPVHSLSVQQIAQLADKQKQSASQFAIVLWNFDPEGRPARGSMRAVSFVLFSTGDLGSEAVGALIWTNDAKSVELRKDPNDSFSIVVSGARISCPQSTVSFHVTPDGIVRADSKVLGQLR